MLITTKDLCIFFNEKLVGGISEIKIKETLENGKQSLKVFVKKVATVEDSVLNDIRASLISFEIRAKNGQFGYNFLKPRVVETYINIKADEYFFFNELTIEADQMLFYKLEQIQSTQQIPQNQNGTSKDVLKSKKGKKKTAKKHG